jgi:hypothetical protein
MNITYFKKATKLLLASLAELAKNGVNSTAPNAPVISGPTIGEPNVLYNFTFNSIDQNNDRIYYYIDWGDGEIEEWIGPFDSGEEQNIYHSWSEKGLYSIKAKTKDTYNLESSWETLKINIPRKKVINKNVILENILILLNKLLNSKIL